MSLGRLGDTWGISTLAPYVYPTPEEEVMQE